MEKNTKIKSYMNKINHRLGKAEHTINKLEDRSMEYTGTEALREKGCKVHRRVKETL